MHLRAFAGGLLLYTALFELAPPHAADRRTHWRYLLGFVGGLAVVLISEALQGGEIASPGGRGLLSEALQGGEIQSRRHESHATAGAIGGVRDMVELAHDLAGGWAASFQSTQQETSPTGPSPTSRALAGGWEAVIKEPPGARGHGSLRPRPEPLFAAGM